MKYELKENTLKGFTYIFAVVNLISKIVLLFSLTFHFYRATTATKNLSVGKEYNSNSSNAHFGEKYFSN